MRVLHISKFYPPVNGGIETAARELTEGINRLGVRADVLCANTANRTVVEAHADGHTVVRAASLGMAFSTSVSPMLIAHARTMLRPCDVVHVHMPNPLAALALWLLQPRCAVVLHWHSDIVRQRLTLKLYEPLQRWIVNRADAIIATSSAYAAASAALGSVAQSKVHVIPLGIRDPAVDIDPHAVDALRLRYAGRKLVLAVGRMAHYKGFDLLIDAAAALPDNVRVVLVGGGDLLEEHRQHVRRIGLEDRVMMPGPLPQAELLQHYAAADIFCMPSTNRAEAYGIAMLEAMAMGKPIVTLNIEGSGVNWVNCDGVTGMTVHTRQPAELASALADLTCDCRTAARMGTAARRRFLEHFQADEMSRRTIDLYRAIT